MNVMKNESQKPVRTLRPNGLEVPNNFPVVQYESIHKLIETNKADHQFYGHYSGAWNALAYRFHASIDHKDTFIYLIQEYGSTPPPEERYLQEKTLFDFFSSCFSTFEATFYGLYAIGNFINPTHFPLSSERDQQRVSPLNTYNAYIQAFPNDPMISSLSAFFANPEYQQLREIRNVLTHRTAPGRRMYISIGSEEAPATEWKLNDVPVDESIVESAMSELSRLLLQLLTAGEDFVKRHIA